MKFIKAIDFLQVLKLAPKRVSLVEDDKFCWEKPFLLDGEKFLVVFIHKIERRDCNYAYVLIPDYIEIIEILCKLYKAKCANIDSFDFAAEGPLSGVRQGCDASFFVRFTFYNHRINRFVEYIKPHANYDPEAYYHRPVCYEACEAYVAEQNK